MPAFDVGAFAGWSLAAAALMVATALSYRTYCRARRREGERQEEAGSGGGRIDGGPCESAGGGPGGPGGRGAAAG